MILLIETLVVLLATVAFQQAAIEQDTAWLAGFALATFIVWALIFFNACVSWVCDQLDPKGGS